MNSPLDFTTKYKQFYICSDTSADLDIEVADWDTDYHDKVSVTKNSVTVFTESARRVRGALIALRHSDNWDLKLYDHVVEAWLEAHSGKIYILSCPEYHVECELAVRPGVYRIRIYMSGLKGGEQRGEDATDRYRIEVFPDSDKEILKRFSNQPSYGPLSNGV